KSGKSHESDLRSIRRMRGPVSKLQRIGKPKIRFHSLHVCWIDREGKRPLPNDSNGTTEFGDLCKRGDVLFNVIEKVRSRETFDAYRAYSVAGGTGQLLDGLVTELRKPCYITCFLPTSP